MAGKTQAQIRMANPNQNQITVNQFLLPPPEAGVEIVADASANLNVTINKNINLKEIFVTYSVSEAIINIITLNDLKAKFLAKINNYIFYKYKKFPLFININGFYHYLNDIKPAKKLIASILFSMFKKYEYVIVIRILTASFGWGYVLLFYNQNPLQYF